MLQVGLNGVLWEFYWCFKPKEIQRMFQESLECCLDGAFRVFQGSFKVISKTYKGCFKEFLMVCLACFHGG